MTPTVSTSRHKTLALRGGRATLPAMRPVTRAIGLISLASLLLVACTTPPATAPETPEPPVCPATSCLLLGDYAAHWTAEAATGHLHCGGS